MVRKVEEKPVRSTATSHSSKNFKDKVKEKEDKDLVTGLDK